MWSKKLCYSPDPPFGRFRSATVPFAARTSSQAYCRRHARGGCHDPAPARVRRGARAPHRRVHHRGRRQALAPGARFPCGRSDRLSRRAPCGARGRRGVHPHGHAPARRRRRRIRAAARPKDGQRRVRQRGERARGGLPVLTRFPDDGGRAKHAGHGGAGERHQCDRGGRSAATPECPQLRDQRGSLPGGYPAQDRKTLRSGRSAGGDPGRGERRARERFRALRHAPRDGFSADRRCAGLFGRCRTT